MTFWIRSGPIDVDRRTGRALEEAWADGLSASQIAGELGGITRNAVIGKVHRLGLSGPRQGAVLLGAAPRKPRAPSHDRASRPTMRGNTALAHAAYDYEPSRSPS